MRTLLACLVAFPLAACAPAAVPNGPAAAPETAADCPWSYKEGDTGPDNWGKLCPPQYPYARCENGEEQSPIDLDPAEPAALPKLQFKYGETVFKVVEMYWGQELQAQVQAATKPPYLQVGDDENERYPLVQFHFHNPCEHCPEPRPERELELHLVHHNASGVVEAVVGVRFTGGGSENAAFKAFLAAAPGGVATLDPRALLPPEPHGYYHYEGSLTTPACTEGMRWHVLKQPMTVSNDQIKDFQSRYQDTARRLQDREGRPVSQSRD